MKLLIVRHGQSQGNVTGKVQGSQNPGLSPRGKRQAQALQKLLKEERVKVTYCSPLQRAHETAEAAGKEPILIEPCLRECLMGNMEGMTHEQVDVKYPNRFKRFFDQSSYRMPGGESLRDLQKRVQPFLEKLRGKHENDVVLVVAHSTVNRVLLATLTGIPLNKCRIFKQKNACVSMLYVSPERTEFYSLNNELHNLK